MAFSASCVGAAKPRIYLVHQFLAGQGSLYDYPFGVLDSFDKTFDRNMDVLRRRSSQDSSSSRAPRLFDVVRVRDLKGVPKFLGSGDVVLGFTRFPPYEVSQLQDELVGPQAATPTGSYNPISAAIDSLADRFWNAIVAQWKSKASNSPPVRGKRETAIPQVGISVSRLEPDRLVLRSGGSAEVYYGYRLGIVDTAFPAAAALTAWDNSEVRHKRLQTLSAKDFSPAAVREAAGATPRGASYLAIVGRGLAYNLLHEFWHVAERRADHPYPFSFRTIENEKGTLPGVEGIVFQPAAVENILKDYEKTWCAYLNVHRIGLGEV